MAIKWWINSRHRELGSTHICVNNYAIYMPACLMERYSLKEYRYCNVGFDDDDNTIWLQFVREPTPRTYTLSANGKFGGYKISCGTFLKSLGQQNKGYYRHKRVFAMDKDKDQVTILLYQGPEVLDI